MMACQTCDETMQLLGHGWFWCPTCGTIKRTKDGEIVDLELPRLTFFAVNPATNAGRFDTKLAEIMDRRQKMGKGSVQS